MATRNLQRYLDSIYSDYIDENGKRIKSRDDLGNLTLDRATSRVEIRYSDYFQGLTKQYKTDNSGMEASTELRKDMQSLARDAVKGWKNYSGQHKSVLKLIKSDSQSVSYEIPQTKKTGGRPGKKSKNQIYVRNFTVIKQINDEICKPLIEGKYRHLFEGRTENMDGSKRAPADIGHVNSLTEKGQAGLMLGELKSLRDKKHPSGHAQAGTFVLTDSERALVSKEIKSLNSGLLTAKEIVKFKADGTISKSTVVFYEIELSSSNKAKQAEEKKATKAFFERAKNAKNDVRAKEFMDRPGSPSMKDMVASSIVNTPTKKKLYKKKLAINLTKYRKPLSNPSKTSKAESKKRTFESGEQVITGLAFTKNHMGSVKSKKSERTEKGRGTSPEDFAKQMASSLKIKNAINKRLPAEIKRNMGRPALNNRTGRFRASAIVENITPAAQTLMIKYTYRLDPYETFENTGKRKWPNGYNPKPLISKSIRGLALSMFKITNLTTRRV